MKVVNELKTIKHNRETWQMECGLTQQCGWTSTEVLETGMMVTDALGLLDEHMAYHLHYVSVRLEALSENIGKHSHAMLRTING